MEKVLVLDFGGQYNQLIARRVRDHHVYAEIIPYNKITVDEIKAAGYKGVIFTGGPNSVYDMSSPHFDPAILDAGIPILGICYGCQLIAYMAGGTVESAEGSSEYGMIKLHASESLIYSDIPSESIVWMSHTDYVSKLPEGFTLTGTTDKCPCASMENAAKKIYAVQYHPEVTHSEYGKQLLYNFLYKVCKCTGDWVMESFIEDTVAELRETIGDKGVILGLSGGVDSSVAAALLSKAIGKQLTCVFVDHGLLRKNESEEVEAVFGPEGPYDLNFIKVDAKQRFYDKLAGVTEPEAKRKIIGEEFIRVFEDEAKKIGAVDYLVQGTIYPDVIESGLGKSAVIKSHHNVGGLPDYVDFKEIIEPLRMLFKDEVRKAGLELGIPDYLVYRQPFPGPGLGIRIIGDVTPEKVKIVQDADYIYREEIAKAMNEGKIPKFGQPGTLGQYFAALTNMRSVGVMGDFRTYDYAIALRAVLTSDFMTAEAAHLPWDVLDRVTTRIVNEVEHVNRVIYDCTGKPPGTIEFE